MTSVTAPQVKNAKPGRHADSKGLYLFVKPSRTKSWVLRVQADGRRRDFGPGPADLVSFQDARDRAIESSKLVRAGLDPFHERKRVEYAIPTFEAAADFRTQQATEDEISLGGMRGGSSAARTTARWLKVAFDGV